MRKLRTYISIVLLALMSFSIVPKEFIHDLYDHEDTVEQACCRSGILHLETPHHHCEILTYAAFPFLADVHQPDLRVTSVSVAPHSIKVYAAFNKDRYNLSRFRAPPTV